MSKEIQKTTAMLRAEERAAWTKYQAEAVNTSTRAYKRAAAAYDKAHRLLLSRQHQEELAAEAALLREAGNDEA